MAAQTLFLSGDPDADALLADDPLALVIGMVLDQQIPLERAFKSPFDLKERLGGRLDAAAIAVMDPDRLAAVFADKPALHRFPSSMAGRVQQVCRVVTEQYGGDAAGIWTSAADGKELMANLTDLPGFGAQKARIFVALLGKQLGVHPSGWRDVSTPFGDAGSFLSIADIDSPEALTKVRKHKQQMKAAAKAKAPASR
ncbi:MAG: HhH-GPD-type base excision DNA repair protein [Acidimicrobiales bacterium]